MNPETLLSWTFLCDFLTVCRIFLYLVPTITAIEESVTIQPTSHRKWEKYVCADKVEEWICGILTFNIFGFNTPKHLQHTFEMRFPLFFSSSIIKGQFPVCFSLSFCLLGNPFKFIQRILHTVIHYIEENLKIDI